MKINTGSFWSQLPNKYSIANSQPKYPQQFKRLDLLVPDWAIVSGYKDNELSWEEYTSQYVARLAKILDPSNLNSVLFENTVDKLIIRYLQTVVNEDQCEELTLCCWEKESDPHCHRKILFGLIPEEYRGVCK